MKDQNKTKAQLIAKLQEMRQRVSEAEQREKYYHHLTENVADVIWTLDTNLNFTYVSPSIYKQRGYTAEEVLSHTLTETITPESLERVMPLLGEKLALIEAGDDAGWEAATFDVEQYCQDGTTIWTHNNAKILPGPDGQPISILGVTSDITKRVQAAEALNESVERLKGFDLHSSEGIYRVDITKPVPINLPRTEIVDWVNKYAVVGEVNDSLAQMYRLDAKDMVGKPAVDFAPNYGERAVLVLEEEGYFVKNEETEDIDNDGKPLFLIENYHGIVEGGHLVSIWGAQNNITERVRAEEALRESEARYRTLFEHANDAIFLENEDDEIIDANRQACELMGYTRKELLQMTVPELQAPEIRGKKGTVLKQEMKKYGGKLFESTNLHHDGTRIPVEVSTASISGKEAKLILAIVRDITERKQAEGALRESEEGFRNIVELSPNGIVTTNLKGEVLSINRAFTEITGFTENEMAGKHFMKVPTKPKALFSTITHIFSDIIKEKKFGTIEFEWLHKNGEARNGEARIAVLKKGEKSVGVQVVLTDITERVRAAQALRESEGLLRKIAENYPNSYLSIIEKDFTVGFTAGPEFTKQNLDAEQFIGLTLEQVFGDKAAIVRRHYEKTFDGEERSFELFINDQYQHFRTVPLQAEDGSIPRILAAVENITERRQIELALRQSEERYRSFVLNFLGIAFRGGMDFTPIFFHGAVEEITGYTEKEFLAGQPRWDQVIHPEDLSALLTEDEEKLHSIPHYSYEREYRIVRKDGVVRWVHEIIQNICDSSGNPANLQGTIYDITERKQAEMDLLKSEARYRGIFEGVQDAIFMENSDGDILDVNERACQIFGYSREELLTKNVNDLVPPGKKAVMIDLSGASHLPEHLVETINIHADGKEFPAEISGRMYHVGDEEVLLVVLRDITERKKSEKALNNTLTELAHSQQLLLALSNASQAVQKSKSQKQALQTISEEIVALGYHNTVFMVSDDQTHLELSYISYDSNLIRSAEKLAGISAQGYRYPIQEGSFFHNMLTKAKAVIDYSVTNAIQDALPKALVPLAGQLGKVLGVTKVIYVPLIVDDKAVGMLSVIGSDLMEADLPAMTAFGNQVAISLENARLYREATQRLERLASLRKIDQAIMGSSDLKVTLGILLGHLLKQLEVDAADVLLYEKSSQTLTFSHGQGFHTRALQHTGLRLGEGHAGEIALQRRPVFIPNLGQPGTGFLVSPEFKKEGFVAYYGIPLIAKGVLIGVLEIFHRSPLDPDVEWVDYLQTLAGQTAIAIDNITLFDELQYSNASLVQAYDATIEGWAQVLELRDMETEGHSRRVVDSTMDLAQMMGVSDEALAHIRRGALLHDIGKMGVPDAILQKPGKLTDDEWQIMWQHPKYAYDWLSSIKYLRPALDIPYSHHERWDGSGYPQGLKGEQIPLAARIFAIVDVWDALLSDRPYRKAWSKEKTLTHIQAESGKHFDPQVVNAFIEYLSEIADNYRD